MEDPRRAERLWLAMAVAMLMAVLVGGQEEAQEQTRSATRKLKGKRRVGRPPKPIRRPRGREQSCLMRGQQAIQAAVVRGEEIPAGHVVTEAWPVQTFPVGKPTKSWVKKRKGKEDKKRYQKNKQARACHEERTELGQTEREPEKKGQVASPPKQVQKRERAEKEREAKRLLIQEKRDRRKHEQEEHRTRRQREREERKLEKEQKRERRLRSREEREQERLRRKEWHEEIRWERELRLARKQERMASKTFAAQAKSSAVSTIFSHDETLMSLPKPP